MVLHACRQKKAVLKTPHFKRWRAQLNRISKPDVSRGATPAESQIPLTVPWTLEVVRTSLSLPISPVFASLRGTMQNRLRRFRGEQPLDRAVVLNRVSWGDCTRLNSPRAAAEQMPAAQRQLFGGTL